MIERGVIEESQARFSICHFSFLISIYIIYIICHSVWICTISSINSGDQCNDK